MPGRSESLKRWPISPSWFIICEGAYEEDEMRIAIGSDHAGFALKTALADFVRKLGHEVADVGCDSPDPVDYPDYTEAVGKMILGGEAERGIMICGSGVGASVAANKMPGVRAGLCHDTYSAHQSVEHDDINMLVLGGRVIGPELAHELVKTFLGARFTGEERHVRRLAKVRSMERRYIDGARGDA